MPYHPAITGFFGNRLPCALLAVLLAACGSQGTIGADGRLVVDGDAAEDDHPAGPLHPDAVLVDELACFDRAEVLTDDRQFIDLHFSCAAEGAVVPGQLVIGVEDGGYLRRVDSVTAEGGTLHLTTSFASLAEAVTDVEFDEELQLEERQTVDFSGRVLDEVEVEGGTATVTARRGTLSMTPTIRAQGKFGFLRLKSVTSRNRIAFNINTEIEFATDGPVQREEVIELDRNVHPFTLRVGPVSVRGQLDSVVRLRVIHESTEPMHAVTGFTGNGTVIMGGTFTMPNSWSPYWNPSFEGEVVELEPAGSGDWKGRVIVEIDGTMSLKGNPGGNSHYELWSEGTATGDCDSVDWATSGGLDAETFMQLRFMGKSVDHIFPHLQEVADTKTGTSFHVEPPPACVSPEDPAKPTDPEDPTDPTDPADPSDPIDPADFPEGPGLCAPTTTLACGESRLGDTSGPDAGTGLFAYPCSVGNYDAPEVVYEFTAPYSGFMELSLVDAEPTALNHDLFVLDGGDGCSAEFCIAQGFNSVGWDAVAGATYYLVVDGYWDQMGPYEVQLSCN